MVRIDVLSLQVDAAASDAELPASLARVTMSMACRALFRVLS